MKSRLLLTLLLPCLLGLSACATAPAGRHPRPPAPPPHVVDPARPLPPGVLLISAVYGSGANFTDVSQRVNDLLRAPGVEFFANPHWLHTDPTPGWNKALVIVYEHEGRRRIFTAGENGKVSLALLAGPREPGPRKKPAPAEKVSRKKAKNPASPPPPPPAG